MSVIRFPTHLVSTLEISEAIDWPHSELMKDARATAKESQMPADWSDWFTTAIKTVQLTPPTT
jgi:hypothetical protein